MLLATLPSEETEDAADTAEADATDTDTAASDGDGEPPPRSPPRSTHRFSPRSRVIATCLLESALASLTSDADGARGAHAALAPALRRLVAPGVAAMLLDASDRAAAEAALRDEDGDAAGGGIFDDDARGDSKASVKESKASEKRSYYSRMRRAAGFASPPKLDENSSASGESPTRTRTQTRTTREGSDEGGNPSNVSSSAAGFDRKAGDDGGLVATRADAPAAASPEARVVSLDDLLGSKGAAETEGSSRADTEAEAEAEGEGRGTGTGTGNRRLVRRLFLRGMSRGPRRRLPPPPPKDRRGADGTRRRCLR